MHPGKARLSSHPPRPAQPSAVLSSFVRGSVMCFFWFFLLRLWRFVCEFLQPYTSRTGPPSSVFGCTVTVSGTLVVRWILRWFRDFLICPYCGGHARFRKW